MRILTLILPVAALTACSSGSDPAPVPSETVAAASTPTPSPSVDLTESPAPAATGTTETATTIPAAAVGRWGLVANDCLTRADNKGLLTITPTTLKFYESIGELGAIKERTDTRLRAAFAFEGEGMKWNRDMTLDVQDGGKTLIRREYGDDAAPGPFKYSRC